MPCTTLFPYIYALYEPGCAYFQVYLNCANSSVSLFLYRVWICLFHFIYLAFSLYLRLVSISLLHYFYAFFQLVNFLVSMPQLSIILFPCLLAQLCSELMLPPPFTQALRGKVRLGASVGRGSPQRGRRVNHIYVFRKPAQEFFTVISLSRNKNIALKLLIIMNIFSVH